MGQAEEEDVDTKRLCRDFHNLMKTVGNFSNGQVRLLDWREEDLGWFKLEIKPCDGLYYGGTFIFKIFTEKYPKEPPVVVCQTRIYHPNIDTESDSFDDEVDEESPISNVCVSLLSEDWDQNFTFEDCIQSLLFLFYEPNTDDPLNPLVECGLEDEEFAQNVKDSLLGRLVDSHFPFDRNYYLDDEDAERTTGGEGDVVVEIVGNNQDSAGEMSNLKTANEVVGSAEISKDRQNHTPEVLQVSELADPDIYRFESSQNEPCVTDAAPSVNGQPATNATRESEPPNPHLVNSNCFPSPVICDNSAINCHGNAPNPFEIDNIGAMSSGLEPEDLVIVRDEDGPLLDQQVMKNHFQKGISVVVHILNVLITRVLPELYKS